MKKLIPFLLLLAVLIAGPCFAVDDYTYSSGLKSSSGVVGTSGKSYALTFVEVLTDGSNAATVSVYNGTTAGGTLVGQFVCSGASNFCGATYEVPVSCERGIYVGISGTGAGAIIGYQVR